MAVTELRAAAAVILLQRVLARDLEPDAALREWPDIDTESDELLAASWHDLSHYAADEDIRAKDLRYANFQTELLKRRIEEIKQKFSNRRRAADE
jgi:hypothetical protein